MLPASDANASVLIRIASWRAKEKKMKRATKKELLVAFNYTNQPWFNPKMIRYFWTDKFYNQKSTVIYAEYLSEKQLEYLRYLGYICCVTHQGDAKLVHIFKE